MSTSNSSERKCLLHRGSRSRSSSRNRVLRQSSTTTKSTGGRLKTRAASVAILLSLMFERAAFYGLSGNLVLFLNLKPLLWQSYNAMDTSLYFFGMCFAMSLIGGWLADSVLGRFKAIFFSFLICMAGYIMMLFLTGELPGISKCWNETDSRSDSGGARTVDIFQESCSWLVIVTLTVIAVGTGFVKASIAPFGSDQVTKEGQQATLSFFNWFYWCLNLGALVGLSLITWVEQWYSFSTGYLISLSCLGISTVIFAAGRFFYRVKEADGSILTNIFRIIREAFRRRRQKRQRDAQKRFRQSEVDSASLSESPIRFLDYAKHRHGGAFHDMIVEDVRQLKIIFAVFAVLIPYWLVYFQMQTSFLVQALHMRLDFNNRPDILNYTNIVFNFTEVSETPPQVVAAWLSLFDVIVLILLLPLFDRVIYPWLERRSGVPVSISQRIFLGMLFAVAAMVVAGLVEHFRLQVFWGHNNNTCTNNSIIQIIGKTEYQAADMTVLWQIPQYILIGLSEVFTSVAGLQFAVSIAPRSMKGIITGLFYLFSGIGSFLGTAIVAGLSSAQLWFLASDFGNINCRLSCSLGDPNGKEQSCHLDYYFYLLASIEALGALLFLLVCRLYRLDEHHRSCRTNIHMLEASGEFGPVPVSDNEQDEERVR